MSASQKRLQTNSTIVKFCRTGDWWVDFGLVNLHQQIDIKADLRDEYEIRFSGLSPETPNSYSLAGSDDNIKAFLIHLKNEVVQEHYSNYKSGKKNFYLDNQTLLPYLYEKTSVQLHLKKFFGGILSTPEYRTSFSKLTNEQQTVLEKFLENHKDEFDTADINRVHAKDDKLFVGEMKFDIGWEPVIESGNKTCCFSGLGFCRLEDAKGYHYPALVTPDKMQTFYSGLKGKLKIGAPYALACIMAPLNMRYVLIEAKGAEFEYVYFVPVADTLYGLRRVQATWVPEKLDNPEKLKFRNFDTEEIYTSYLNESVLSYLLAMYSRIQHMKLTGQVYEESMFDDIDIGIPELSERISIMAFTDSEFCEFRGVGDLFAILIAMAEKGIPIIEVKAFLRSLIVRANVKNNKVKTYPREVISRQILEFTSIGPLLEQFMFDEGGAAHSFKFYRRYTEAIGLMNAEQLDLCENIGTIIGMAAANRKGIGVIYDFRNSKTRAQFMKALEMFQFILDVTKGDPPCFKKEDLRNFIYSFLESPEWQEMKSAVVIKAVNIYQASAYAAKAGGK
jgi:hypothetical protein